MKRINITLFSLMLVGVLFSCTKASLDFTQNGNWVGRAPFPGVPSGSGASFVIDNKAYVGTGINPLQPNFRVSTMYQYTPIEASTTSPTGYDSALGSWRQIKDYPGAPRSNAVGFAVGNKGYLGTGVDGNTTVYADFWSYDPSTLEWTQIASMTDSTGKPFPRMDAAAFGFDNAGYVLTGTDLNYTFADIWRYDPGANTWTQLPFFPGSARSGAVTWVYNGKGYLLTGHTPGSLWSVNNQSYDFWIFDPSRPEENAWTRLRDISNTSSSTYDDGYTNIVRQNGVGFIIKGTTSGDKGYLTLGSNGTSLNFTWEYDFASDLWTEKTPFEGPARVGAVGFSLYNQTRGFVGTGIPSANGGGTGFQDMREFYPNQIYNQFD